MVKEPKKKKKILVLKESFLIVWKFFSSDLYANTCSAPYLTLLHLIQPIRDLGRGWLAGAGVEKNKT